MIKLLQFTVPNAPVAKGRGRVGFSWGGSITVRTPAKTKEYEKVVAWEAKKAMAETCLKVISKDSVKVVVTAYIKIPTGMSRPKKADALAEKLKPITRPDLDNYIKSALDGMNGVVYADDSCVTTILAKKRYSDNPRLEIEVYLE